MLLIIGRDAGALASVRDIFFTMGMITELSHPIGAKNTLSPRHSAVIVVGRELGMGARELLRMIRSVRGDIPTVAIREDVLSDDAGAFDAVFPNSLYCAGVIARVCEIAQKRGIKEPGRYGFDRIIRHGTALSVGGESIPITKTECAVTSVVMAFSPISVSGEDIRTLAFRSGREPSLSGVRTHISAVNRRLCPFGYRITSRGDGYQIKILSGSSE